MKEHKSRKKKGVEVVLSEEGRELSFLDTLVLDVAVTASHLDVEERLPAAALNKDPVAPYSGAAEPSHPGYLGEGVGGEGQLL